MKKTRLLFTLAVLTVVYSHAQNTFPSTGNVGIGTITPVNKLELGLTGTGGISLGAASQPSTAGVMRFVGTTGNDGTFNGGNITGGDNGSAGMAIINTTAGSGGSQDVAFYSHLSGYQSGQKMIIKADGNVGIGTTTPSNKLEVRLTGTGGISLGLASQPSTAGVMRFVGTTGNDGTFNGGNITGGDNGSAGMAIINTTAGSGGSQDVAFYSHLSGYQSSQKMIIKADGNVGIGTTDTKGYRLAVNGNAIFTGVKVKQYGAWPDYVFDADYALTSLADVETYIKAHKHLPDMTAADEVAKEGLDLGGNQGQLLKKIEELTLYVIQQQKEINELRKEIKH